MENINFQSEGEKEQDKSADNALTTSTNLELGFPEDDEEQNNPEGRPYLSLVEVFHCYKKCGGKI